MSDAYPLWWDSTLTIYNRFISTLTYETTWFRHVINDCFWKNTYDEIRLGANVILSNIVICRIPQSDEYMELSKWQELPNDEKREYFTLGQGHIIVKGEVTDEIDEYIKGRHSTDLLDKYTKGQGCMEIDNFVINIGGGRNNPHYFVKGQ